MDFRQYIKENPDKEAKILRIKKQYIHEKAISDISENEGIQELADELTETVNTLHTKLLFDDMTAEKRKYMMGDRDRCLWFLDRLKVAASRIKRINEYLEKL